MVGQVILPLTTGEDNFVPTKYSSCDKYRLKVPADI